MELAHAQPKLFDTEHARGRKLQTEKIAFELRGYASTWSSALSFLIQLFCFYFTFWCILNPLPSRAYCRRYVLQVVYCGYRNIIQVFSNVSLWQSDRFHLLATVHAFTALSQSGDRYELCLTTGEFSLQIGVSVKCSYWLKLTSLGISSSRIRQWACWALL